MPITVATTGNSPTTDDTCTNWGFLPLTLPDGTIYWQPCFYCINAADTIISPQAILASSDVFFSWTQTGYKDGRTGMIRFDSKDGLTTMQLALDFRDGLYYCPTDIITVNKPHSSSRAHLVSPTPIAAWVHSDCPQMASRQPPQPTSKHKQLESELWLLRLGSPGVSQLDILPSNATGIPTTFQYHPFRFIDFREQAGIRKEPAQRSAICTTERCRRFYMDFGFMRALSSNL
jgi:hypothetical protein